jgi:hypothetical protein
MPLEILKDAEKYYLEAIKLVSAMSRQRLEAFIFYFSSLKLVELKVLQAIAINSSSSSSAPHSLPVNDIQTKADRDYLFQSSLKYLLDSLHAKQPFDNPDLHFLCSSQLGYLLSIGPKKELSVHCFVRSLLCLSCMVLRSRFTAPAPSSGLVPIFTGGGGGSEQQPQYEINNLGVKRLIPLSETRQRRTPSPAMASHPSPRPHFTHQQMGDEAKRLTSLALLASLKLVQWMKPAVASRKGGGGGRGNGFGVWSFEEYAPFATRLEALVGESHRPPGLSSSSKGSVKKTVVSKAGEPDQILIHTKSGILRRTPTLPLDPPPAHMVSTAPDQKRKMVEFEVEVEEQEVIKTANFIRPRTPLRDGQGNLINVDEIPVAPDHIKAPPMEYEDVTVTKLVKKKLQKLESLQDGEGGEGKSLNGGESVKSLSRTTSKPFYDPDKREAKDEEKTSGSSFFRKLSTLFSTHDILTKKTVSKALTKTAIKMKDALATSTDFTANGSMSSHSGKNKRVEVIGSEHGIFSVAILSHLSRQLLVLKGTQLEVGKGARVKSLLASYGRDHETVITRLKKAHQHLKHLCETLTPCPWSLQELSDSCSLKEIKQIFKSQVKISNSLSAEENLILTSLTKHDPFLNSILTIPSFSRLLVEDSTPNELKLDETNILLANNVTKDPLGEVVEAEYRARRQTKFGKKKIEPSSTASSSPAVLPLLNPENFTPLGLPSGAHIGLNAYTKRDGRRLWSAYLDSTVKGVEGFFGDHLSKNEAVLQWHLFSSSLTALGTNHSPLQCTLIWKDTIQDVAPYGPLTHSETRGGSQSSSATLSNRALHAAKHFAEKRREHMEAGSNGSSPSLSLSEFFAVQEVEKVFMECCRSDVDLAQIHYAMTTFLESLHSRPAPIRCSKLSSALSLLSDCFALTELLSKLPSHVDTLVICSSPYLSLVPWSLLLIDEIKPPVKGEDPFDRQREKAYDVGDGGEEGEGTLPLPLIHVMDKYVVRLGTSLPMMELNSTKASSLSQAPGMHKLCYVDGDDQAVLPLTEVETHCVANLWSGDHWDFNVLQGIWASIDALSTRLCEKTLEEQSKEATEKKILKEKARMKLHQQKKNAQRGQRVPRPRQRGGEDQDSEDDANDGEEDSDASSDSSSRSGDDEEEDEKKEDKHTKFRNSKSIANCRVLHLSAIWDPDSAAAISGPGSSKTSLLLPLPSSSPHTSTVSPALALPDNPIKERSKKSWGAGAKVQEKKRFDAKYEPLPPSFPHWLLSSLCSRSPEPSSRNFI